MVIFCENAIQTVIPTPSTYRRVSGDENMTSLKATVEFDAQNKFGATVRSLASCQFDPQLGIISMNIDGRSVQVTADSRSTKWIPSPSPKFD